MNSDSISKAQIYLDLLLKHDSEEPKCKHSVHDILQEAVEKIEMYGAPVSQTNTPYVPSKSTDDLGLGD